MYDENALVSLDDQRQRLSRSTTSCGFNVVLPFAASQQVGVLGVAVQDVAATQAAGVQVYAYL